MKKESGMDFSEALMKLQAGVAVRRPSWINLYLLIIDGVLFNHGQFATSEVSAISAYDIMSSDWEVVNEL
jgi:hypothetical protein